MRQARPSPSHTQAKRQTTKTYRRLALAYPEATCALEHHDPFQLLVAVVLSAQTTDTSVNRITPSLFSRFGSPQALGNANLEEVQSIVRTIGMYKQKAQRIIGLSRLLMEKHAGQVPRTLDELIALPGVGRKTANVVLGVAFGIPSGVVVDTHVQRLSQRLGWSRETSPEKIEIDLMELFPQQDWIDLPHVLIFHGRKTCTARAPACEACPVHDACPSAFKAENVGRKARPKREK